MKFTKGLSYLACYLAANAAFASTPAKTLPTQKHEYKHTYLIKGAPHYKGAFQPEKPRNHFEVIGAGGIAKLNAGNSQLGVTSSETDTLHQTNSNSWNTLAGQLGVGYVYYFRNAQQYPEHVQWFSSIEPQLNLYQLSSNSIDGNVLRFNNPNFNQLTYDIPFHSTRLMLDAALTVATWKKLSLYAIAGIGNAWNRASYSDTSNASADCADQQISLNSHTNSNFVWEAGAGVNLALNDRFSLSLEYLYTDLGTIQTSWHGATGSITTPVISAPSFNVRSQTGLLGLHIAI